MKPNKDKLVDLYDSTGTVGFINWPLPLYDQLVRIFRENIAPSGGNNDAIHTSLVDLLYLAHECATSEDPAEDFTLDVMDFIFHDILDTMIHRNTVPYAPYIMLLIKHSLLEFDWSLISVMIARLIPPRGPISRGRSLSLPQLIPTPLWLMLGRVLLLVLRGLLPFL
jgi:hypothetical protein